MFFIIVVQMLVGNIKISIYKEKIETKLFFCKCKKGMYIHVYILYICNPRHGSSAVYKMYFIRLYMMLCIVFKLILLSWTWNIFWRFWNKKIKTFVLLLFLNCHHGLFSSKLKINLDTMPIEFYGSQLNLNLHH